VRSQYQSLKTSYAPTRYREVVLTASKNGSRVRDYVEVLLN